MNTDRITQQYLEIFPGDFSGSTVQRQTPKILWCTVTPEKFPNPELIIFNGELSEQIGLGELSEQEIPFLAGNNLPQTVRTYATAYAGHQFGNWAGQLGDGRAIFAGEIKNEAGEVTEIQWKGAGATPYSRFADGRAVLRSSLREYLMSEAMHFLGIPTSRALSLVYTGEEVVRDIMYSGNPEEERGAVVIRTAPTFLRFGHFELLAAQKETALLQQLTDFTIDSYFPEIKSAGAQRYKDFFTATRTKTADLMVEWLRVGFVHGVMNTDNMSILGLTIDYGPFSMLDTYDLNFTPNTTDLPGRRYSFGRQPQVSQWNLWQLSNALFPLINDAEFLEKTLEDYSTDFWEKHDRMMASKFGFDEVLEEDGRFFTDWQSLMTDLQIDYTLFFAELEKMNAETDLRLMLERISYMQPTDSQFNAFEKFLEKYRNRKKMNRFSEAESLALMRSTNPKFTLRNYLLFECIEQLEKGDRSLLEKLLMAIRNPYETVFPELMGKRPSKYLGVAGCSMLSCSS